MGKTIPADVAKEMWLERLDDRSVTYIHEEFPDYSRKAITDLFAAEPPESLRKDPRLLPYKHIWVSCHGFQTPGGEDVAFVVVRMPQKIPRDPWHKGLRGVRRAAKEAYPGAVVNMNVLEFIENDVARRFVDKGYPAWEMDGAGTVTRLKPEEFGHEPETEPEAAPPGP